MSSSALEQPAVAAAGAPRGVKPYFITAFLCLQMAAMVLAATSLFAGVSLAWLGALAAAAPVPAMVGYAFASLRLARTTPGLAPVWSVSLGGFGLALVAAAAGGGPWPAVLCAAVSAAGTLVYVFWYSRFGRRESELLRVGRELPDFTLEDESGAAVSSARFRKRPTVLLFFRGNWCPLCMAQVREIAARYRAIEALGAQVVLVSPQPHASTRALARRFDAPLRFLVDPQCRVARQLGILHPGGLPMGMQMMGYDSDTVLPTVIVTGAAGRILFSDQTDNYRVRPTPETFLAVLRGATGQA